MKIWINGRLVDEGQATVSVFDSGFVLGDGVWEGLRVARGQPAFLEPHLGRLYATARAIMLDIGLDRAELTAAIQQTIAANDLVDDAHLRVMVTRGVRRQPYQDPRLALGSATVVIVPALSPHDPKAAKRGLELFTVHVRRGPPDVQDQKINSHSKFNCIMACIQANQAGADEALMPVGPAVNSVTLRATVLARIKARSAGNGKPLPRNATPSRASTVAPEGPLHKRDGLRSARLNWRRPVLRSRALPTALVQRLSVTEFTAGPTKPARLCRHLQFHPLLHCSIRPGLDLGGWLLPGRHHSEQRVGALPSARHCGL